MKILITSDTYSPMVNGVVTSIVNLAGQLEQLGHEVRILTLSYDNDFHRSGNIYYVASREFDIYPGVRASNLFDNIYYDELIDWAPEIIHSQTEFFTMVYAKKIARRLCIPMVHTYHTMYEHYTNYLLRSEKGKIRILSLVLGDILRPIYTIIAPTEKTRQSLHRLGLSNPVQVIPTGIRLEQYATAFSEEEQQALRSSLSISPEKKILVTVGRLGMEKNVDELIDHMPKLLTLLPEALLLIVGDGPHKATLEERVNRLGLGEHIRFTGMISPEILYQYYKLGDVFVSASVSETQGLTYIEALASGTPLICRYDPCLELVLQNGKNGFSFQNQEEYLRGVEALLRNSSLREQFSQEAVASAETFSLERFGKNVEALYQKVVAEAVISPRRYRFRRRRRSSGFREFLERF